jgi:hypothetical protein
VHTPTSIAELTTFGRVRLSKHFFMREMLYSEVSNFCQIPNIPEDPDLAIEVGKQFCERILEPLRSAFGHVTIRSAYRSPMCNGHCHELFKSGDTAAWCLDNTYNAARHTWDKRDQAGFLGATATVVLPAYIDYFSRTQDWKPLGWWIRDNLPDHDEVLFFRHLCAFNIRWYEGPGQRDIFYLDPPTEIHLTKKGAPNFDGDHSALYQEVMQSIGVKRS